MTRLTLVLIAVCVYATSLAQVTLNPQFPALNEPVTITYNATQGNGALTGISPVYMHTGVIMDGETDWQYVQGNWGTADANVLMTQVSPNVFSKTITIAGFYGVQPGDEVQQLAFVFRNAAGTVVGRAEGGFNIFVNVVEGLPEIANPPAGVVDGINYIDDTTVILQLFAPGKDFVHVIGDFNGWQINASNRCKKTTSGDRYWLQVNNLTPGQEYRFQYSIDAEDLRVADVYAEKILDPFNDQFIGGARYPGLIPYPVGLTTEIVSVLQTAQEPYPWEVESFFRPPLDRMVIYEVLVRDFTEKGTFQGVIDRLDYIKGLGVNAIELMPVNEFEGNDSWGYNPSFFFAVDKYYGPADKFKELVDECHKKGIAVILDVVFNHSFGQNPQLRMYSENGPAGPPTSDSPWFNTSATHPFSPGYDYNHNSPHTQSFVKRALQYWIQEYKIDGYRFDLSKGFTQNNFGGDVGAWSAYDQSRVNNWLRIRNEIHEVDPFVYLILEHFADNSEETVLANAGFMLWGNNHFSFNEASMGFPSNFNGANYQQRGWTFPNLVSYAESHDEERLMYNNVNFGNSSNPAHDTKDTLTALKRMEATAALNIPLLGPKMIWQFGELGYDYSINRCPNGTIDGSCRTAAKPVRWDYYLDADRHRLYKVYAAINKLKTEYPAFSSTNYNYDVWGFGKRLIIQHGTMDVVIIANFGVQPLSIVPGFTSTGVWYDYFAGTSIIENNLNNAFLLQPGEYRIYTSVPLPTPDLTIQEVEVTFRVDMSLQTINTAGGGVGISGSFNNFAFQPMVSEGNGVYAYTTTLLEGEEIEYKFRNGTAFESVPATCGTGGFSNRTFIAPIEDVSLPVVCYASCSACPSSSDFYPLTLKVDASQLAQIATSGIHIAGNFNNFNPTPMLHEGNSIYSFTTSVLAGSTVLWKYTNGSTFATVESVPSFCGSNDGFGGFNRTLVMPSQATTSGPVCFSSCEACPDVTCTANGGTLVAPANRSFCVGTGTPVGISVTASGAVGTNQRWALVNATGDVVDSRSGNSNFNLDSYPPGNYSIRYIRFENDVDLSGITNINQVGGLQGCYSVAANAINLFLRPEPQGGTLTALGPTALCAGSGSAAVVQVQLTGAAGENSRYGVADLSQGGQVVATQAGTSFNFNSYAPGNYRIVHLSYQQGVNLQGVLTAADLQGCYDLSNPLNVSVASCLGASLSAWPNPTAGVSTVTFSNPDDTYATLEVWDMSGRLVERIFAQTVQGDETYTLQWDGGHLPNGVYLYKLTTAGEVLTEKLMLAR